MIRCVRTSMIHRLGFVYLEQHSTPWISILASFRTIRIGMSIWFSGYTRNSGSGLHPKRNTSFRDAFYGSEGRGPLSDILRDLRDFYRLALASD